MICTDNGKICVPKHQCGNGTINTGGIDVIIEQFADPKICSTDQVCCAFPAQVRDIY